MGENMVNSNKKRREYLMPLTGFLKLNIVITEIKNSGTKNQIRHKDVRNSK